MVFPRLEASLWFGAVDFKEVFVAVYDTYVLVKVTLFAFQTLEARQTCLFGAPQASKPPFLKTQSGGFQRMAPEIVVYSSGACDVHTHAHRFTT